MAERVPGGSSRFPGFYKLSLDARIEELARFLRLSAEEAWQLRREALPLDVAEQLIENVIGVFGMPIGLAVNFRINERDYVIPMAVEEASIVAAASHLAKLVREHGTLTTDVGDSVMIGQVQIVDVSDPDAARQRILDDKERLLRIANEQDPVLHDVGGGARDLEVRVLDSARGPMVVVHILVDVRDAMGANAVNTMAEELAVHLAERSGGKVCLRILSNLADRRLARARVAIAPEAFNEHDWNGEDVVDGILNASAFAQADPYRATTHNKGVMNGIDPILVATGNDWRAVEAGAHAFAARDGAYRPLTAWERDAQGLLIGHIELPMAVGLIGGATKVHPMAQLCLGLLRVESASELAGVIAAVGLVQNLAALRSLVTEGIQKGHMILHARNVAVSAGAVGDAVGHVANQMIREGRIRFDRARQILRHWIHSAEKQVHRFEERLRPGDSAKPDDPDTPESPE